MLVAVEKSFCAVQDANCCSRVVVRVYISWRCFSRHFKNNGSSFSFVTCGYSLVFRQMVFQTPSISNIDNTQIQPLTLMNS